MAKKYGDCDDYANLAKYIFKDIYKEYHVIVVFNTNKGGHSMFIGKSGNERFKLFSNLDYIGSFESIKEAARWFFAEKTSKFFLR